VKNVEIDAQIKKRPIITNFIKNMAKKVLFILLPLGPNQKIDFTKNKNTFPKNHLNKQKKI